MTPASATSTIHNPALTGGDPMVKVIPWWAVAAASASPVLLIGGFFMAAALQPASYNPVRDTISQLAWRGATDSWVMTSALAGAGSCVLFAALGLQAAAGVGRIVLAGGGVATLSVALFRQPPHGYSLAHELAVIAAAGACCTWPVFASHRRHRAPLLTRLPSYAAAAVSLGLAAWYALESHGALLGLAERCALAGPALWLLAVVATTRRALTPPTANDNAGYPVHRPTRPPRRPQAPAEIVKIDRP
jgi:Protein of unknown function (DUF998)